MDQRHVLPPHLFLAFILIMWGAHTVFPFFQVLPESARIFGILFVMDGLMSVLWARHVLKRQSTAIHSWSEPTALLTQGPYRVTRNPIYLGMTTMLIGVALVLRSVLVLPLPFFFAQIIQEKYIRFEEAALESRFGEAYRQYKDSVRRWM